MSDYNNDDIDWDSNDDNEDEGVGSPAEFGPPPVISSGINEEPVAFNQVDVVDAESFDGSANIASVAPTGTGEHMTVIQIDANGNEVSTTVDLALPPLDEDEAREITERIKGTTNVLYLLIKRAHAGKAYKALGYSSFESYVREEFSYSRSYAYKLLNQATVIEAIEAVVPEGTEVYVGELTARGLKSSLPELLEDIEERSAEASPEEARAIIEDAIRDVQGRKDEDDSFDEDFDNDFTPNEFANPSNSFDYIDDDDDTLDEFLGGDDPSLIVQKLESLYNLLSGLQNFADLSENSNLDDLLPLIPEDRRTEVSSLIDTNIEWMQVLKTGWTAFLDNAPVSNIEDDEDADENDSDEDINF